MNTHPVNAESLLDTREVARRFNVCRQRVYAWVTRGTIVRRPGGIRTRVRLGCVQLPGRVMFTENLIATFITELTAAKTDSAAPAARRRHQPIHIPEELIGTYPEPRRRRVPRHEAGSPASLSSAPDTPCSGSPADHGASHRVMRRPL